MQDFAGSTVVHLIGATGALAALLHLGPRIGKYGPDGKPRAIPGHSMPIVGLGDPDPLARLVRVQPGLDARRVRSAADGIGNRFAEVALVTQLAAAAGVLAAMIDDVRDARRRVDVGMAGNGAIAGLVAITAPSGYVEFWAAPIIGAIGGIIVVFGVLAIEKKLDDPVGALSAHGLAGIWGTLVVRSVHRAEVRRVQRRRRARGSGTSRTRSQQLGAQALGVAAAFVSVFVVSYAVVRR